jgi:UDPglucose 6-dehydrogenase
MPEFLTERTCFDDFNYQPMIFTGNKSHIKLLKTIFPGKKYIIMSSEEAEMAKYTHNVFGVLKVTYFNCIYDICKKKNLNYEKIIEGVLGSTYINSTHTQVPGPDGKFGYGGKCFPKDLHSFTKMFKNSKIYKLLQPIKKINRYFRDE